MMRMVSCQYLLASSAQSEHYDGLLAGLTELLLDSWLREWVNVFRTLLHVTAAFLFSFDDDFSGYVCSR